jgi:hypothetical protein
MGTRKSITNLSVVSIVASLLFLSAAAWGASWSVPGDFPDIQTAINSPLVIDGDKIVVEPGEYTGATVTKPVEIKGEDGAIIKDGPVLVAGHPAGDPDLNIGFFFEGGGAGSGATISHFKFENVEFPVFSRGADDVTVTQCTMVDPIQGVSNWAGSGWEISHNVISDLSTASGGGIGILVADRSGGTVSDNVVSHNKISGTLHVWENDCGQYNGSGIVLYADFRWGGAGAEAIQFNRVVKNKVSLTSDTPLVVDVVAFELTDTRDDPLADPYPVVFDNAIGFNDFRGTVNQIFLTPTVLDTENKISRNLGNNRGHGLHPSVFGPDGN